MKPEDRDLALLLDMQSACDQVMDFMKGIDLEAFSTDRMRCFAVERALEILGEAAGRVSPEFQRSCTTIPWRQIRGLRNILAHEYGHIEYPSLYRTTREDIPPLLKEVSRQLRVLSK